MKSKISVGRKVFAVASMPEIQNAVKILFALHEEAKIKNFSRMTFDLGKDKEHAKTYELIFQRVHTANHQ